MERRGRWPIVGASENNERTACDERWVENSGLNGFLEGLHSRHTLAL